MIYTIEQISSEVKEFNGKFGVMKSYRVKFRESESWVEISQKPSTPPPVPGQELEGTIDLSGPYGPKFKKEYVAKSGGAIAPARGPKTEFDNFTMYLSYAKDLVVSLQMTSGYNAAEFEKLLEATVRGGRQLYDNRPGNTPAPTNPHVGDTDIQTDLVDPWSGIDTI